MAKSSWMEHLKQFRAAHPGMKNSLVFKEAGKTYKKQSAGSGMLASSKYTDTSAAGSGMLASSKYGGSNKSHKRHYKRKSSTRRPRRGGAVG